MADLALISSLAFSAPDDPFFTYTYIMYYTIVKLLY